MFRDVLRRRNLQKAWDRFQAEALRQIAIDWCEENNIPYVPVEEQ